MLVLKMLIVKCNIQNKLELIRIRWIQKKCYSDPKDNSRQYSVADRIDNLYCLPDSERHERPTTGAMHLSNSCK